MQQLWHAITVVGAINVVDAAMLHASTATKHLHVTRYLFPATLLPNIYMLHAITVLSFYRMSYLE